MSLGNIRQKFDAFGWTTLEMNGNDMDDVVATLEKAKSMTGQGKTSRHYDAYRKWGRASILWRVLMSGMGSPLTTNS
jgi:hypothetical protein